MNMQSYPWYSTNEWMQAFCFQVGESSRRDVGSVTVPIFRSAVPCSFAFRQHVDTFQEQSYIIQKHLDILCANRLDLWEVLFVPNDRLDQTCWRGHSRIITTDEIRFFGIDDGSKAG
jgi:hypothetical protein